MVGSGARNLILQNENNPIDLDYNLEIIRNEIRNYPFLNKKSLIPANMTAIISIITYPDTQELR